MGVIRLVTVEMEVGVGGIKERIGVGGNRERGKEKGPLWKQKAV